MNNRWDARLWVRLIIPILLIPLLGISPRPHIISQIMYRAYHSIKNDSPAEISQKLIRLIDYLPWRYDLQEMAAIYSLEADNPSMAVIHFRHLAEVNRLSYENQILMGEAAQKSDNLILAIEIWEASLNQGGPPNELLPRLYQSYQSLGDYPSQIRVLKSLVEFFPSNAEYHYQLGLLLAIANPEASLGYLLRAGELDPSLTTAGQTIQRNFNSARLVGDPVYTQMIIGQTMASLNAWGIAHEIFNQVIQAHPDFADAWAFLGETQQQLGLDGYASLQKSLELDPKSISGNTFFAVYWQRQGRYDLAFVFLYAAAQIDPLNPVIKVEMGNTLAHLGDINAALSYYLKATELSPREPTYWQALARFSITYDFDIEQYALSATRQALFLDPEDPASLDLMGQIYIRLDDNYTAERFLQRALESDPNYAPAHLHMGFLHLLRGQTQNAYDELTKARTLAAPDTLTANQANRLLQSHFSDPFAEQH